LQLLAGFESDSFARWNGNLGAGPGIPADARFARFHVENAEAAQLNAIAVLERLLHGFKNSLDRHFRFGFGDAGPVDYFVYNVKLNQNTLPTGKTTS
jgi:hypothetical protein